MALNEMDAQVHRLLVRERNREPLSPQKREELRQRLRRAAAEQHRAGIWPWWLSTRLWARFAMAFVVLAALGGAAVALMLSDKETPRVSERIRKAVAKPAQEPPAPPVAAEEASASALRAEVALIAGARRALEAGRAKEAMRLLASHGQRFPAGTLIEEREGLGIILLWRQGQQNAAREGAVRFHRQYPRSPMNRPIRELLDGSTSKAQ